MAASWAASMPVRRFSSPSPQAIETDLVGVKTRSYPATDCCRGAVLLAMNVASSTPVASRPWVSRNICPATLF